MLERSQRKEVLLKNGREIDHSLWAVNPFPAVQQGEHKALQEDNKAAKEAPQTQAHFLHQQHRPWSLIFPHQNTKLAANSIIRQVYISIDAARENFQRDQPAHVELATPLHQKSQG